MSKGSLISETNGQKRVIRETPYKINAEWNYYKSIYAGFDANQ